MSQLHRLLKNVYLRRSPHPSSLQRTFKYASLLRISGALHLGIFDQPEKNEFFNRLFKCHFFLKCGHIPFLLVSNDGNANLFSSGAVILENSISGGRSLLDISLKDFVVMNGNCIFDKSFRSYPFFLC